MTYILKANDKEVMGAHAEFKKALKSGESTEDAVENLHKILTSREENIRKWIGV